MEEMKWSVAKKEIKREVGISRRDFLKVLAGVSAAVLGGLAIKEVIRKKSSDSEIEKVIEDSERWKVIVYGEVGKEIIETIKLSIETTFSEMQYQHDKKNLDLKIFSGEMHMVSGEKAVAFLDTIPKENRATIQISIDGSRDVLRNQKAEVISLEIIISVIASHEAAHFVQFQRGKNMLEVHAPDLQTRLKLSTHPLEIEANDISGKVVSKLFGIPLEVKE